MLKHEQHLVNENFRNSFFTVPRGIEVRISLEVEVVLTVFGLTFFVSKTPHASEVSREFSAKSTIPLDMKKIERLWQHSVLCCSNTLYLEYAMNLTQKAIYITKAPAC